MTFLISEDGAGWNSRSEWRTMTRKTFPVDQKIGSWKHDKTKEGGPPGIADLPMNPLRVEDDKTWGRLDKLFTAITTETRGPSLAAYRAFLLATSDERAKDGKIILSTSFCNDELSMGDTRCPTIVHHPTYATLQSAYLDSLEYGTVQQQSVEYGILNGGGPSSRGTSDMTELRFPLPQLYNAIPKPSAAAARPIIGTGATGGAAGVSQVAVAVFQDYAFVPKVPSGHPKCLNPPSQENVKTLVAAHRSLRKEYDRHFNWVYWLLSLVVEIDLRTSDDSIRIIFSKFITQNPDKNTATKWLELLIRAARKAVLRHYMRVERIYHEAIEALK